MMTHDGGSRPDAVVRWIGLSIATRPYPAYRDSGVHGLGRVPKHWEVRRVKHSLAVNVAVLPEDTEPEYEFRYIDIGSVGTGELISDPKSLRFETAPSRARRVVGRGDTLVSTVRTYLKAVWHAEEDIRDLVASTGFAVLTPRPWILPKFVGYVCRSEPFTDHLTAESAGVVYPAIAETRLASALRLCIPPLPEQRAIVRFLDHADRRIRRYIRAKERLIKLLEEQKQAIIHQAVTGQIDVRTGQPYPAYKDSGVEWLGEVPEHWCERPLKRVARIDNSGSYGEEPAGSECVLPVATTAQIDRDGQFSVGDMPQRGFSVKDAERYRCEVGDILVVKSSGSIFNVVSGKAGMVDEGCPEFAFSNFLLRVVADKRAIAPRLLFALLGGWLTRERVKRMVTGSTYPNLRVGEYVSALLPIPPRAEQSALIRFLDHATKKARAAISKTHQEIDLLLEYRTRLIADVVTGKLDVREVAAARPDSDPPGAEDTLQDTTEPDAELQPPHP